jgi:hypothetical protein
MAIAERPRTSEASTTSDGQLWVVLCYGAHGIPGFAEYTVKGAHGLWHTRQGADDWVLSGGHKSVCDGHDVEINAVDVRPESDYIG